MGDSDTADRRERSERSGPIKKRRNARTATGDDDSSRSEDSSNSSASSSSSSSGSRSAHASPPPAAIVATTAPPSAAPAKRGKRAAKSASATDAPVARKKRGAAAKPGAGKAAAAAAAAAAQPAEAVTAATKRGTNASAGVVSRPLPTIHAPAGLHARFRTTMVDNFYTVIAALSSGLLNETNMVFRRDGMFVTALDHSNTTLIDWRITTGSMEGGNYSCNHDYRIKIDLDLFATLIKAGKRCEIMELQLDGELPGAMTIVFEKPCNVRTSHMHLIQDDNELFVIPEIRFEHSVVLASDVFKENISSISKTATTVTFEYVVNYTSGRYTFSIISQTQLSNTVSTFDNERSPHNDETPPIAFRVPAAVAAAGAAVAAATSAAADEGADDKAASSSSSASGEHVVTLRGSFLLNRIENFVKVTKATRYVQIYPPEAPDPSDASSTGKPLRITYEIAALGVLSFYLAPRVSDADE